MFRFTVMIAVPIAAAAGLSGPAMAQEGDLDMACVSAVADKAGVDMSDVHSDGLHRVGEGTEVRIRLGKMRYKCYVNDDGEVTNIDPPPAAPARAPAISGATLRANCKKAAEKYLNLAGASATIGESRDVGDQVEIDASYYAQTVTCTVEKATGKVINVG